MELLFSAAALIVSLFSLLLWLRHNNRHEHVSLAEKRTKLLEKINKLKFEIDDLFESHKKHLSNYKNNKDKIFLSIEKVCNENDINKNKKNYQIHLEQLDNCFVMFEDILASLKHLITSLSDYNKKDDIVQFEVDTSEFNKIFLKSKKLYERYDSSLSSSKRILEIADEVEKL